jgi:hypothetical protein
MQVLSMGGNMNVNTIESLESVANVNTSVYNTLHDLSIGRKAAAAKIWEDHWVMVSEKLVRTYRDKHVAKKPELTFTMPLINLHDREYNVIGDTITEVFTFPKKNPEIDLPQGYMWSTKISDSTSEVKKTSPKQKPKTIVIMPDVQAPLHDKELVAKFVRFLGDYQPTELGQVGDFTDSTEISRWVRGKKPEFAGDLSGGFKAARSIITDIRNVFDGRIRIVRSNHDDRLELYIQACAPGLASLMEEELSFETIMKFKETEVEFIRDAVVELAPNWIMAHGDEGSLSPQAGKTAFGLAKNKFGVNVVCGHTHRAGVTTESYGYNGSIKRSLSGLEVGHFMDLEVADYLKKSGGHANWQQAFGILEIYGDRVYPRLITVQDGSFSVDGVLY